MSYPAIRRIIADAAIATTQVIIAEQLCEDADLRAGQRVLDVAAGSGNVALAAARRGCEVVAVDASPPLLERARIRTMAERLRVTFKEAGADDLPFEDASFDVVLSAFGVTLADDPFGASRGLLRVCKPGGKIGLCAWKPDGFFGQVMRLAHAKLAAEKLPALKQWGTREGLRALFGRNVRSLSVLRRSFRFRCASPQHWLEVYRACCGPMVTAFAALDAKSQAALERELLELVQRFNQADDGTMVAPSEYVDAIAIKR
jgi:ubiquinone/menaquinone biosynthesis C-methylase UbiE